MPKANLLPNRVIRFCGADCSHCNTYKQFLKGDESGLVNPENNYHCCWLPKDYPRGRDCEIRMCCEKKDILFCGECEQFDECAKMKEFYSKPGYDELKRRVVEEVERRKRNERAHRSLYSID